LNVRAIYFSLKKHNKYHKQTQNIHRVNQALHLIIKDLKIQEKEGNKVQ